MKHYFKILLLSFLLSTVGNAVENSTSMLLAQYQKAEQVLKRLDKIHAYANRYILSYANQSGITKDSLNGAGFGLTPQMWKNYENKQFTIADVSSQYDSQANMYRGDITYGELFPNKLNPKLIAMIKASKFYPKKASFNVVGGVITMRLPIDQKARHLMELVKSIDPAKITISKDAPADTSKLWYKPDGMGGFYGYNYNGTWKDMTVVNAKSGVLVVSTIAERDALDATRGDKVYVKDGTDVKLYIYDGTSWKYINGFDGKDELTVAVACDKDNIGTVRYGESSMEFCADNNGTAMWKAFGGTQVAESAPAPEVDTDEYTGLDYNSAINNYGGLRNSPCTLNNDAFAAIKSDGSIATWGYAGSGANFAPSGTGYTKIFPASIGFTAVKSDGSLVTWWGSLAIYALGYTSIPKPSGTGYTNIASTRYAFAALKSDGSIVAWGGAGWGGSGAPSGTGYTKIFSNDSAFSALKSDGSIVSWGFSTLGGSGAPSGTGYTKIVSTTGSFAALKSDGSIVAWGSGSSGGLRAPSGTGYTKIFSTKYTFAALKSDGSVVSWGSMEEAPSGTGYIKIFANEGSFAALKSDGSIVSWGGTSEAPSGTGYTKIFSTAYAFAALKSDGSIVSWGNADAGGSGAPSGIGYKKIFSNQFAFAALKSDGSIVSWGNGGTGGSGAPSGTGYTKIFSTGQNFTAVKSDGSLVSWGNPIYRGSGAPAGTGFVSINGTKVP